MLVVVLAGLARVAAGVGGTGGEGGCCVAALFWSAGVGPGGGFGRVLGRLGARISAGVGGVVVVLGADLAEAALGVGSVVVALLAVLWAAGVGCVLGFGGGAVPLRTSFVFCSFLYSREVSG